MGRLDVISNRVIQRYGVSAQIVRMGEKTGPDYNPTYGPDILIDVLAALTGYQVDQIDGTRIKQSDQKAHIATDDLTIVPKPSDRLKIGSDTYAIISISSVQTSGATHHYKLQVRA